MTVIYLLLIAISVFMYTITSIVLSQELSAYISEITESPGLGTLSAFMTGLILIVGAGIIAVKILKNRFTRL